MAERADVIAAITEKGMAAKCEVCSHDDWLLPTLDGNENSVFEVSLPVQFNLNRLVGFYPMICRHCGNTRFIHKQTLLEGPLDD